MTVLKFGGTSMGSAKALLAVVKIIQKSFEKDKHPVVVCSAMSGVTDQLLKIGDLAENWEMDEALQVFSEIQDLHFKTAEQLGIKNEFQKETTNIFQDLEDLIKGIGMIHELSERSLAYLTSFGERLSTRLLAALLVSKNASAVQRDSNFIKTQGHSYWEDEINWGQTATAVKEQLLPDLEAHKIPIVTGFFGTNDRGIVSLLGRGGSDFSGAVLAVSLGVSKLEIWTDVDGFLSADPRLVDNSQLIEDIGFEEVSELCFFGAKVLHPKTIRPVIDKNGEVWIKNTFASEKRGTRIAKKVDKKCHAVISISSKKVSMVTLDIFGMPDQKRKSEVLLELFTAVEDHEVCVDAIASSEAQISFCIEDKHPQEELFLKNLSKIGPVEMYQDRKIICIVSPKDVQGKIGVAADIFKAIASAGVSVEMYSQNASEIAQLIVVKSEEANQAVSHIHEVLVEGECRI